MKGGSIQRRIRDTVAAIEAEGGADVRVDYGKHIKFRFRTPDGVEQFLVTSMTPSDWRTPRINRSKIRRLFRPSGPAYIAIGASQ